MSDRVSASIGKCATQPLISLIIPIYNGEKYIDRCLSSIQVQTYEHIEVLCIVNGSTDQSQELVQEWANKDNRIHLVLSEKADLGTACNIGIRKAKGDYISFVDVDDWVTPNYIEELVKGVEKGYRICKSNFVFYYGTNNRIAYTGKVEQTVSIRGATWLLPLRPTALYDKTLFEDLAYLEDSYYEDLSLWPILVAKAGEIYYINQVLYYYDQTNESSIMTVVDERHLILDKVFQFIFSHLTPEMDQEINLLITTLFIQTFWTAQIQYIPQNEVGNAYLKRVQKVIANRLIGYYYIIDQLPLDKKRKQLMIDFYKSA
ncbi:TPA: glycosyltransferase family 2 protein [Streptococcus suis]|nr:glycosyltransferase family 2 protein [Streptococcus suis]HEL9645131.1 glycosyltransferase family 2 protein [Streptococcus suis]